ncbi:MAG: MoxR family ATPase [Clostridiales bacterium]|nr:MoxR family ATPase [Clostridiales bacterium]
MNIEVKKLVDNIEKVIVGKQEIIVKVITALLSGGHVLIEDVPGVGKTQLVSALAKSLNGVFNRIQLTPDIMPTDIVGFTMLNSETKEFEYRQGVAICNFLLADEINRASPKSQSSLLEIMEENQISLDGRTYLLPKPFMTLATQNPIETYGTFHLPEAQLDRFLMKISIGYPNLQQELEILNMSEKSQPLKELSAVMSINDVLRLKEEANNVFISDKIKYYILNIVNATRNSEFIKLGASPRGSIALMKAAKSFAFIQGREYVVPDDVKEIVGCVLSHRIILSSKGKSRYLDSNFAINDVFKTVAVPTN